MLDSWSKEEIDLRKANPVSGGKIDVRSLSGTRNDIPAVEVWQVFHGWEFRWQATCGDTEKNAAGAT